MSLKVMSPVPAVSARLLPPSSVLLNRMLPAPTAPVVIARAPPLKVVADANVTLPSLVVTLPPRSVVPVTRMLWPAPLATMLALMSTSDELIVTPPIVAVRTPLFWNVPVPATV